MMHFVIAALLQVLVLVAAATHANAQSSSNEVVTTRPPDRADPAALDACRGQITALGSSAKVGQLQPLLKTSIKVNSGQGHAWAVKPVRAKDLRIYAARVEKAGYFGLQNYDHVCFFEKLGDRYRFIQSCSRDVKTGSMQGCDLRWLRP